MAKLIIFLGLIAVVMYGTYKNYLNEKKQWNDGICPETGRPWKLFEIDSQGGRGYISSKGEVTKRIWISWKVDKNHGDK